MAKLSGIKCFSILVASGNGHRCGALRGAIREATLCRGPEGEIDAVVWKNRDANPAAHRRVAMGLFHVVNRFIEDVPAHVLGPDGRDWTPGNVN